MSTQDLKDIFAINAEATRIERARCLQAVDDEPELPGHMPDDTWGVIAGDRDATEEAIRIAVRLTSEGGDAAFITTIGQRCRKIITEGCDAK